MGIQGGGWQVALVDQVIQVGLLETMNFEQRPGKGEDVRQEVFWRESIPVRENSATALSWDHAWCKWGTAGSLGAS